MWLITLTALRLLASLGVHPIDDPEAGHVEVSWQCDEVRAGRCFLGLDGLRTVVVWYRASKPTLQLQSANRSLHTFPGQETNSAWARIELPDGKGRLTLTTPSGRTIWALNVEPLPREPATFTDARRAFDRGELSHADVTLRSAIDTSSDPGHVALALDLRQRIAFRGRDFALGLQLAGQALTAYESIQWTSRGCELRLALAVRHIDARNDPEAARSILRAAAPCAYVVPSLASEHQYLHARVAEAQGRWREANAGYERARRLAERLQRREDALGYLSSHYVLADGLHDDAAVQSIEDEIQRLSHDEHIDICTHATVWTNIGWTRLMRRQRGWDAPDPRPLFEQARAAFEGPTACRSRPNAENNRINLALAELQAGRHTEALALIAAIAPALLDLDEALWFHIAAIEARLAAGDIAGAAASVTAMNELAAREHRPEVAMHAAYHQGLLFEARGRTDDARAAYAAAEAARDKLLLPLGFGSARERAAADWDLGVARTLALLLAAGRPAEALCTVRAARRRTLRAAEQLVNLPPPRRDALREKFQALRRASAADRGGDRLRSARSRRERHEERRTLDMGARSMLDEALAASEHLSPTLPCAALRLPGVGELQLFYYPVGRDLLMFAADDTQIQVHRATLPRASDPALLAETMLAPFDLALQRAKIVRVYGAGYAADVDVHALPWRGRPLLASIPVAYSVDITHSEAQARKATATLVVADSDQGLRQAGDEADAVVAAWQRLGLASQRLDGEYGRQAVLDRLADSLVFHFIGHAGRSDHLVDSPDPWNTELQLADRSSISVDDVLAALPSAPPVVLLSACETGSVDARSPGGGLSLAPALVLRGATAVIATTRPVDDGEASELMKELYRQASAAADLLDPALLSRAQMALLDGASCEERPNICAFRAWVP